MKAKQVIKYECEICKKLHDSNYYAEMCCTKEQQENKLIREHMMCPICKKSTELNYCVSADFIDITTIHILVGDETARTARYHKECTTERTIVELISGCR